MIRLTPEARRKVEDYIDVLHAMAADRDERVEAEAFVMLLKLHDQVHQSSAADVLAERRRQVEVEGWTSEHDDAYGEGELARAAAAYAYASALPDRHRANISGIYSIDNDGMARDLWPATWSKAFWKPKDRRRDLVRAAALILAEIERLDRMGPR